MRGKVERERGKEGRMTTQIFSGIWGIISKKEKSLHYKIEITESERSKKTDFITSLIKIFFQKPI